MTARAPTGDDGASERSRQIASANARIADFRRAGQVSLNPIAQFFPKRGREADARVRFRSKLASQWERVVDESTALIKICPRNSSAYCARGQNQKPCPPNRRAPASSRALTTPRARVRAGAAYGKLGFFSDSVSDFSQAIRCDPTSYLSFFNRAMAYTRISRYAEAVADLKRVLEIEPAYTRAHQLLAKVEPHAPSVPPPPSFAGLSMPLSSESSFGSCGASSSRSSSPPKSPSPSSVVDGDDQQHDALAVLGDLGIIEDEFDISLLTKLFDDEDGKTAMPAPKSKSGASSTKRSSQHTPPTSKSKKPRTPPAVGDGGSFDQLDAMIDNSFIDKASSRDWSLGHDAAAWFSLD